MRDAVNKLATADCLLSLALVALQDNYVKPIFTEEDAIEIVDGRHPMVEALRTDPFVPNTVRMGSAVGVCPGEVEIGSPNANHCSPIWACANSGIYDRPIAK